MKDFLDYVSDKLGSKEVKQFRRAIERPMCEFHQRVIAPQFYQPAEQTYLGIALDKYVSGKNHLLAQNMRQFPDYWHALTYFTNPLSIPPSPLIVDDKAKWVAPMDRVVWGHSQVLTYEFDQPDLDFFKTQMAWCRSSTGKPLNCAMGRLFKACSQWIDFEGITVNFSGNKSFHIHIVFSTADAKALGIEQHIREGHDAHWHNLLNTVMDTLKPGVNPDMSMWQAEKYRRLPNGVRKLDKPNILGIPAGEYVPQTTIWEKFRIRATKGANTMFFDPMNFVPRSIPKKSSPGTSLAILPSGPELDFCREKMRAIFNDQNYPAFHDFVDHKAGIRARFTNHAGDENPASYMDGDYRTVSINGSNPLNLTPSTAPQLPKALLEMLADWSAEFQAIHTRHRSPIEQAFAAAVVDKDSARREMAGLLVRAIRDERHALICAPEGISKTSGLFSNHARIDRWLRAEEAGSVMYAFGLYKTAYDKAEEFNAYQDGRYRAVVLESFGEAYGKACTKLGFERLDATSLSTRQFPSLWKAIESLQPEVIEIFRNRHAELWAEIGDATPVFFVVHGLAHNWRLSSKSRQMWARSFWALQGKENHAVTCLEETKVNLLIHDEIKDEHLVAAYPAVKVDWVNAMIAHNPKVWRNGVPEHARRAAFLSYTSSSPCARYIDFEDAQDIAAFHGHEWARVITSDSGEYGKLKQGYAKAIGQEWCFIARNWPTETAKRTLVLTTETVPLEVARKSAQEWAIFDLDTPRIKADVVETHARRGITGKNLSKLCQEWQQSHPDHWIVSNKVPNLENTMTHHAARGSNKLIGKDILQTMTFITPEEFEKLEALNAWTGLDCLVRQRHIDEFNQTAGRNLGFRKRGDVRHHLLINQRLFELLAGAPKGRSRYSMKVIPTAHQRVKGRKRKVAASQRVAQSPIERLRVRLKIDHAAMRNEPWADTPDESLALAA